MTTTTEDVGVETREQVGEGRPRPEVNVGNVERLLTGAIAGALLMSGIRRSLPGLAIAAAGGVLAYRAFTGHCGTYQLLGINTARRGQAQPEDYFTRGIHVEESCTISKSPQELYEFWHNFENLPRIMSHVESVEVRDDRRSHWVAKGPAGTHVEWDAEVINDEPNQLIAWHSLEGADVDNAGSVRFVPAPGDRGTEVRVVLDYIPPAGRISKYFAMLFGEEPGQQVRDDLRRFKQIMEAGEVPTTQGQPRGTCA